MSIPVHVVKAHVETIVSELLGYGWNEQLFDDAADEFEPWTEVYDPKLHTRVEVEDDTIKLHVALSDKETGEVTQSHVFRIELTEEV